MVSLKPSVSYFLWASFEDKYLEKSVDISKVTFLAV